MFQRKFSYSVLINKPIEEVFQFMTDPSKLPLWIKDDKEGQSEILQIEPPKKWLYKTKSGTFTLNVNYTLTPVAEGVNVEGKAELDMGLFSLSLTTHLVAVPMIKARLEDGLKKLKEVLESGPAHNQPEG